MSRLGTAIALLGFVVLATRGVLPAQADPSAAAPADLAGGRFSTTAVTTVKSSTASGPAAAKAAERQREGTRISDEIGTFQFVGDRVAFLPSGNKDSYRVLENLALERISQALGESRGQRTWVVSGTLTEFRGANYLLVTKAIIQLHDKDAGGR